MKRITFVITLLMTLSLATIAQNKNAQVVKLNQVDGAFQTKELTLKPGDYVFEVTNKKVDHAVGFVVAPAVNGKAGEHIKDGYLSNAVEKGETASSKVVSLKKGTYKYFCPLNPTPEYTITVK